MKNNKRTHAIKAALFSLLGILLLTGLYIGVNRFIFAAATDREIHLDPIQPIESASAAATLQMRLDAVPEGYPFPEFSITVPDGIEAFMTPNTISSDDAAVIISRYIWEIHGTDISGKVMHLGIETFPSGTRTHWEGLVWSPHDVYDFVIHYRFSIDSVTGERIAISINDWFPSGSIGEDISDGCHETLVAFYTEIAADFAQRHFHFTTVESVSYEGMRNLNSYQTHLVCECDEPRPCPVQTLIHEEYMYYYNSGCPALESRFGRGGIPTIQCQECGGGINQPSSFFAGSFPCHAITNGETMLDFVATDDTGRSARIAISMETRRLNSLSTQHNDIVPGFDAQPDRETDERLPGPGNPAEPLYPFAGPFLTAYLGPDNPAWAMQIPPYTDFHGFFEYPGPTLTLNHDQNQSLDWQFISMDFSRERIPISVSVVRRRVNDVGDGAALESISLTILDGWAPGLYEYKILIFDDGYDYFYFVRTVWPEGYAWHYFRVNSGSHPEVGIATPPQILNPTPPPESPYEYPTQSDEQSEVSNVSIPPGTVWDMLPTLTHSRIFNCNCGQFVNDDWLTIDPFTGEITGDHLGHGGPQPGFVYDRERGLFGHPGYGFGYHDLLGMHPIGDFIEMLISIHAGFDQWRNPIDGLIAVESVDYSLRQYYEREYMNQDNELVPETFWYLPRETAFTGRFALMNNRQFVTDFIFDGVSVPFRAGQQFSPDVMAVSQNGMWGIVNWRGDTVLPFIFENLVMICHSTAFARYNGRYGILDIPMTAYTLGGAQ